MRRRVVSLALALTLGPTAAVAQTGEPLRLSFADAVRRAAGGAPAVTLAGLRTDEARGRLRQSRSPLLPDLAASGSWVNRTFNRDALGIQFPTFPGSNAKLIGPFDVYDLRLQVTQALFDYASVAQVRAVRSQLAGAQADSSLASEGAAQATALAYLRATRAQAAVAAREADSTLAAELVGLAHAQQEAGVGTRIDVTRARTQLVAAAGALVVARNLLERARIDLARTLGLAPDTPLALADTLDATLPVVALPVERDSLVAAALDQRPDLQVELAHGEAARRASAAISAERLPRVALAADLGANGTAPGDAIATRQIAVAVTVPILDGFRREGRRAEQRAVVQASAVRADELRDQIAADVDAALLDRGSAEQQLAIAAERLRLAHQELDQARERFAAGVAGNIEVIDAQSSLIRARDTDIDARFAAAAVRVALARAVGVARTVH
ncbi:MAG: TolC family protein [Gemmatimonadales bacterium]